MSTYSVWHGQRLDASTSQCFLTAINVQELRDGSPEFMAMLIEDLEQPSAQVNRWEVSPPFAVDYLSAESGELWQDQWLLTWRLTLFGTSLKLPTEPFDVTLWDSTWDGEPQPPAAFEVIAAARPGQAEPQAMPGREFRHCHAGHVHAGIAVQSGDLDAAAGQADSLEEQLRRAGWTTRWRG